GAPPHRDTRRFGAATERLSRAAGTLARGRAAKAVCEVSLVRHSLSLPAVLVATFLVMFIALPALATVYTDWLWFGEVGHQQVFSRILSTRMMLGTATFLLAFGVLFLNIRMAQSALVRRQLTIFGPEGPRIITVNLSGVRL